MADYISRNDFDALLIESSGAYAKEGFRRMDFQLDLSMRTAGVLEGWSLKDCQTEYQCVLDSLSDGPEAHPIDGDRGYEDNQYLYYEDRIVVPEVCSLGGLATGRCGGHASKQAGKALLSQGHPHRIRHSRILATLEQNKRMYKNTSGYVHRRVKRRIGGRVPQVNRHLVANHIPSPGATSSVACRYGGSKTTPNNKDLPQLDPKSLPSKGPPDRPRSCSW